MHDQEKNIDLRRREQNILCEDLDEGYRILRVGSGSVFDDVWVLVCETAGVK